MPNTKITNHCLFCGKEIKLHRQYCNRTCHCSANNLAIREWEHNMAKKMESEGWTIFRPASCCDRLGVKDGRLYFIEFKPKGKTKLRDYQKTVLELVPHMYRVVIGRWDKEDVGKLVIRGGYHRKRSRISKSVSRKSTTSRFRGVNWDRVAQKWRVRVMINGTRINLGAFTSEEDAARAYDKALREHFGPGSETNFSTL